MKLPHAARALRSRHYRLFLSGQAVSLIGTWMQMVLATQQMTAGAPPDEALRS